MFCRNCGREIKEGKKFCAICGTPVKAELTEKEQVKKQEEYVIEEAPDVEEKAKSKKKRHSIILWILMAAILAIVGIGIYLYLNSDYYYIQKNFKMAEKDLEEGNERDAIKRYKAIYTLDKGCVDAYVKAADGWLKLNEYEEAYEVLQEGLKSTEDDLFSEKIEYLKENLVLVKETFYEDESMIWWSEPEYDKECRIIGGTVYNADGSIALLVEMEYDKMGNEISYVEFDQNGNVSLRRKSEYDEAGNEKKYVEYDEDGNVQLVIKRTYDSRGNEISYSHYEDGVNIKYEYEYGFTGDLKSEATNSKS